MKKINKIIGVFVLLLNITNGIYAQRSQNEQPVFKGTLRLPGNVGSPGDSLLITYRKPYTPVISKFEVIYLVTDQNGNFNFKLPKYPEPYFMQIMVRYKGKYVRLGEHYFVEPNDNVMIDILKDDKIDVFHDDGAKKYNIIFHGNGAEKYNIVSRLEKICGPLGTGKFRDGLRKLNFKDPDNFKNKVLQYANLAERLEKEKANLIKSSSLSNKMQKMITYEYARIFSDWAHMIYAFSFKEYKDNQQIRMILKESFNENKDQFRYQYDPIMGLCPVYLEMLALREAHSMLIMSEPSDTIKLVSFYNSLKTKYSGLPREILITNLFTMGKGLINGVKYSPPEFDSLLNAAEKIVATPDLKTLLVDQQKMSKGKKLFDASFMDLSGKNINTASLKGKVFLIDMWYVGCSWCAVFHKNFHDNVYPLLRDNKDFVYLSISVDKTKERWLSGLSSGKYTSSEYVNVNLGETLNNHPFINYYNIQSFPFTLLVDKNGNIYSNKIGGPDSFKIISSALEKNDF